MSHPQPVKLRLLRVMKLAYAGGKPTHIRMALDLLLDYVDELNSRSTVAGTYVEPMTVTTAVYHGIRIEADEALAPDGIAVDCTITEEQVYGGIDDDTGTASE